MMKRKLRFLWITCSVLMLGSFAASAQSIPVSGIVSDQNGAPLIGVTVLVQGTTIGSITDASGAYSLSAPGTSSVLTYSYVGYAPAEVVVGNRRQINVTLQEDIQSLSEVIVVGYGTRRAGEVTGSISTVNAEAIQKIAAVDAGELLRNVPGVTIMQSNTPGAEPTIRIRGMGTMNDASPLWVVDGVPGAPVSPNNIETITILKDAAASAIYGTRASNGVILVTTKAGKKNQKASISLNLRTGFVKNSKQYDLLNTQEYGEMLWLQAKNDGVENFSHPLYGGGATPVIPDYILPIGGVEGQVDFSLYDNQISATDNDTYMISRANKKGTDWAKEIERLGKFHDLSMNISGGSENTVYSLQMGYMHQDGTLKWTSFDRYNAQSNITSDVTKWLRIGQSLNISYSENKGDSSNNNEASAISWAYRMQPIVPVYDVMGNYSGSKIPGAGLGNGRNAMWILDNNQYDTTARMRVSGNAHATVTPIKDLHIKTLFGFTHMSRIAKNIDYVELMYAERGQDDYLYMESQFSKQWNWTNTVDYTKVIGKHNFTALLGTEAVQSGGRGINAQRYRYSFKDPNYMELNTGEAGQQNSSPSISEWSLFSVFGRVNYSYDNKYLFEGVVRRDGSSRFSTNYKYGTFPAFSLAWRISEEGFMESTRGWLNSLKLRGGWGITGNDRMRSDYNSYSTFGTSTSQGVGSFYGFDGSNATQGALGFRQLRFGNIDTKWETTKTTNVGFDATLFKGLDITFDVWQRRTTGMLYNPEYPATLGRADAADRPFLNVGEMLNRGFDLDLTYRGEAAGGEFRYTVNANISRYKNEIVKLSGAKGEFLEGERNREQVYTRAQPGTAFPEFFGYIVDGIFETQSEADKHPVAFGTSYNKPGHFKFRDVNSDGVINADDRTYIGSPHPKFTGGLNINLEYKDFDLTAEFIGSYGNKMVNYVKRFIDYAQFNGGRSHDRLYNSWGSPYLNGDNSKAKLPLAEANDTVSQYPSSAFIEDASYLRMRNLMIGYNFSDLLNLPSSNYLRVYAQVSNLFTLTKYSGLDPEVNVGGQSSGGGINMGVDRGAWPTPRQILFGVSLGF